MQNNLRKKDNYFKYTTLVLFNGEVLEEGICTINWEKELYNKNKNKLISSCKIYKNKVNPDSLGKQKVKLALALVSTKLTKALELEYREKAKVTCKFLAFINKHIIQSSTIMDLNKGHCIPEAKPFFPLDNKRVDHIIEISN